MQNGGFFEKRRTSPVALGIIIAGHAALLTAIALNPTRFGPRIIFIPTIDSIRDKDPPPPPEKLPPPKPHPSTEQPVQIDRIVDLGADLKQIAIEPVRADPGPIAPVKPAPDPVFVPASIEPGAMARFQPDYPASMVRAGKEGLATVRVLIGSDGRVKTVGLVTATDPAFFEATRAQALRYWRFRPATKDGAAVESWRTMTVKFRLES